MAIISQSAARIKSELTDFVPAEAIIDCCLQAGYRWRDRILDPVTTLHLFILQILYGNTACSHMRHFMDFRFTASAYCQARLRVPVEVVHELLQQSAKKVMDKCDRAATWCGHKVLVIDGSSFSMADTPTLAKLFGYPSHQKPGCGFPTAHFLGLFDLFSGALIGVIASSWRSHDLTNAQALDSHYQPGDVLLADRAFCSFAHICLVCQRGAHAVFRLHQWNVDFTAHRPHCNPRGGRNQVKGMPRSKWIARLGPQDQIVEQPKPVQCPPWLSQEDFDQMPAQLRVRELRFQIKRCGFRSEEVTLVTTLLDAQAYPKDELMALYLKRWQVEVNLRNLKTTMGMDVVRCQTIDGVLKELFVFGIVYNSVCLVIAESMVQQRVTSDRISFIDVLRWIRGGCAGDTLPQFNVNPYRDRPPEPRVKKRRPKSYDYMTQPRAVLRKTLRTL